jgi:hypothetical protein
MTIGTYLYGMIISTVLCFISWALIVFCVNPTVENLTGPILFYLSLFFFLASFFTLAGFYLRRKISKNSIEFTQAGDSFRQGVFFSLIFVGMLVLQSFRMLTLWNVGLFVIGIGLLEFYFMNRK